MRRETPDDANAVRAVCTSAFPTAAEARLVDALREHARPLLSLVADDATDGVVGHILFSPVTHAAHPELRLMGLAPMAVAPRWQRRGIGATLVCDGLALCAAQGVGAVVVLGHPSYYPRFGFVPASRFGIDCVYDAPEEAFLAIELEPGHLRDAGGTVRYHAAFDDL